MLGKCKVGFFTTHETSFQKEIQDLSVKSVKRVQNLSMTVLEQTKIWVSITS